MGREADCCNTGKDFSPCFNNHNSQASVCTSGALPASISNEYHYVQIHPLYNLSPSANPSVNTILQIKIVWLCHMKNQAHTLNPSENKGDLFEGALLILLYIAFF